MTQHKKEIVAKKVEMLARCYDHVEHKYYNGHTLLTMGWTDGQTFVPVDYRVVSASDDKNLLAGSNFHEDNRTIATKRRKAARTDKPTLVLDMLRNVKGTKADAKYVLYDSWFSSSSSIIQIKKMEYDVVAQLKKNKTYYYCDDKKMTLSQIFAANKKRRGTSKYLLSVIVEIRHEQFGNIPAKIVFVRNRNKRNEWIALVSTDLSLNEEEIIALYGKRWDIEVFFKTCKSYLKLGKEFSCRSFDSTSALVAIVFIRYIKLAVDRRQNCDERSLGELFFCCCKELEDISFSEVFDIILQSFTSTLRDSVGLSEVAVCESLEHFIAGLPSVIAVKLGFVCCEN